MFTLQVYLTLCCALGASAVGAYLHILMNIGGFLTFVGVIGGIIWLMTTPPHDEVKILSFLFFFRNASVYGASFIDIFWLPLNRGKGLEF